MSFPTGLIPEYLASHSKFVWDWIVVKKNTRKSEVKVKIFMSKNLDLSN
jgi:hypothetical protein